MKRSVLQDWVMDLSFMQQSVLLAGIRGPDGMRKFHPCKDLIKWYRRCVLLSAFEGKVIDNPTDKGGGSFTGPITSKLSGWYSWEEMIEECVDQFMTSRDELPYHYTVHFMHAVEIVGYKHSDERIRTFWNKVYVRMVHAFHLFPETEAQMNSRLGDNEKLWQDRSDEAAVCSD
jgi:hypothetical protein